MKAMRSNGVRTFRLDSLTVRLLMLTIVISSAGGQVSDSIKSQIAASTDGVNKVIEYVLNGVGRNEVFNKIAYITDKFGPHVTGSDELNDVIDYVTDELRKENFTNVHKENVTVPVWIRGNEYAKLILPRYNRTLPILGLGTSVNTSGRPIVAEVIVVNSFDELKQINLTNPEKIRGKIVVYNEPWLGSYGATVVYRRNGASEAARCGAIAALVRSVTQFSLVSPHGGSQTYAPDVTKIPVAGITIEDAQMMRRLQDRNETFTVELYMEAENHGDGQSYNVVADLLGTDLANETVIIGGHLDTWDMGFGAMDDTAGCVISWQVLSLVRKLNLKPRRTLRLVLWTAEEQGLIGGKEYFRAHNTTAELDSTSLIMEIDGGTFTPYGIGFSGSGAARAIMEETMKPLASRNASFVLKDAGVSSDTGDWVAAGVPGAELYVQDGDDKYFYYHHTHADTMTVLNATDLDLCTVVWFTAAFTVANLDDKLPRTGDYPTTTPGPSPTSVSMAPSRDSSSVALLLTLNVLVVLVYEVCKV